VDQESIIDFVVSIEQVIALVTQWFYMISVPSSNPSLRDVYYERNL